MMLLRSTSKYFFPAEEIRPPRRHGATPPRLAGDPDRGLYACLELIGPASLTLTPSLKAAGDDRDHVQVFRWSLGFEGTAGFRWPRYLAKRESLIVQLLFELPETGVSLSEVSGTLEYLAPTRPLRHSWFLGWILRVLDKLPEMVERVTLNRLANTVATAASLIPSRDSSNRLLWYLRRFYMVERKVYGVEWRMTRRLVEEVGSRWTGTLGVVFLKTKDGPQAATVPRQPKVIGKIGLKPQRPGSLGDLLPSIKDKWLDFRWRPIEEPDRLSYSEEMLSLNQPGPQLPLSFEGMPR
jgi:hypothetical protein